jgi:phosphomethylpyrimidine synthase
MSLIKRIRSGEIPAELRAVAAEERVDPLLLTERVCQGKAVIVKSVNHLGIRAVGIGEGLRTKVNANIGTSEDFPSLDEEMEKLRIVIAAKADTVMDLSTGGNLDEVRRAVIANSSIPVGTVPIYQAAIEAKEKHGSIVAMSTDDLFEVIERQARDGADFVTVHCGVTRRALEVLAREGRVTEIVSRGGAFIAAWMLHHDKENPLYEDFGRLLEISRRYDLTLSLGDGMRPGCLADASDGAQFAELRALADLVKRSRDADVQVIIEGPGHVPLNQIEANVKIQKEMCEGAPFYVLGPLVTDVAPGYDHITSAIGGALAGALGADFLCYVTPREHLGLPTREDVREGVIVCRIAAHAADVAKGLPGAADWDLEMARARKSLDWKRQMELAIDPERAKLAYQERQSGSRGQSQGEVCTMCGDFCAMKLVSEFLGRSEPVNGCQQ